MSEATPIIYFDNNATTRLASEAREAMLPYLDEQYGNPSSAYQLGNRAKVALDRARGKLARAIGAGTSELVFTGGGSEGNNLPIVGVMLRNAHQGKNVVISSIEHPSVRETVHWAADRFGFDVRVAPFLAENDKVSPDPFLQRMDDQTALVSVMFANNETGLIQPIKAIFEHARSFGAVTHCDGVQALGKLSLDVSELGCDFMSFSAHKFHGPKGVGMLYWRREVKVDSLIHGGPQERARRAGTENIAAIVGMATAAELAVQSSPGVLSELRDDFEKRLLAAVGDQAVINFHRLPRTPNTSSVCFPGKDANLLLIQLDRKGICVSTGSACSSGSLSASPVLLAMGLPEKKAAATLRFSFSKLNTREEVVRVVEVLRQVVC